MVYQDVFIRKVDENDKEAVFMLSNEDYVRKYSINTQKIKWEEHVQWFHQILNSNDIYFYVVSNRDNKFLGQVRYKIEGSNAIVSISLSSNLIGKGKSPFILEESMAMFRKECTTVESIIAYISKDNIPSQKLFTRVGFKFSTKNQDIYKYIY